MQDTSLVSLAWGLKSGALEESQRSEGELEGADPFVVDFARSSGTMTGTFTGSSPVDMLLNGMSEVLDSDGRRVQ